MKNKELERKLVVSYLQQRVAKDHEGNPAEVTNT